MTSQITQYGFQYGAAKVERFAQHKGYAVIGVTTPRSRMEIIVTPSGLLRIGKVYPVKRSPRKRR